MTSDELHQIKEKEIKALREYIDSLHATIDSLTTMVAEMPEDEPEDEEYQESAVEAPSSYVSRKKK